MERFTLQDYRNASAIEISQAIRHGIVSLEQIINFAYQVIEATDSSLNNIVSLLDKSVVIAYAQELEDVGQSFYGVPLLLKGLGHAMEGANNSLGIEFLKDIHFTETNDFVRALIDMGFIIIGQTSYPQCGWLNVTVSDLFGDTANPWNHQHNPGGSSGGSAAAVAIGQVPIATTSDAGGSTRIPASWSGLIGLHPSRGLLIGSLEQNRNQTSHFAIMKTMADLEAFYQGLLVNSQYLGHKKLSLQTRFAYSLQTPAGTPLSQDGKQAVLWTVNYLRNLGYQVQEVNYPIDGKAMMMAYYVIAADNASHLADLARTILGRNLEERDVETITWGLFQTAQLLTEEDLTKAWQYGQIMSQELEQFYEKIDVFITPTTAETAPDIHYRYLEDKYRPLMSDMSRLNKEDRIELIYQQWLPAWVKTPYTQMGNLTGTPSISLPLYLSKKDLPLGVLFNASWGSDSLLMEIGYLFEEAQAFKTLAL